MHVLARHAECALYVARQCVVAVPQLRSRSTQLQRMCPRALAPVFLWVRAFVLASVCVVLCPSVCSYACVLALAIACRHCEAVGYQHRQVQEDARGPSV